MTNQELFDRVAKHLLTQNAVSIRGGCCRYRTSGGLKCAIGVLIPDDEYHPSLEGMGVAKTEVMMAAGLTEENKALAILLQECHDSIADPTLWGERLKEIAEIFHLSSKVLES